MQIFSLFAATMRGAGLSKPCSSDLLIGFQARLIPWSAGLGSICDYVFLRAGEVQPMFVPESAERWACLRGGVRVGASGSGAMLLSGGDIFSPCPGQPVAVQALLDTMLIRMVPQRAPAAAAWPDGVPAQPEIVEDDGPYAAFVALHAGDTGWGRRLGAEGVRWGVCHVGTLRLQWWPAQDGGALQEAYLQPGSAYAPDPGEHYCIDALLPTAGLLCCAHQPPVRGYGKTDDRDGCEWHCEDGGRATYGVGFLDDADALADGLSFAGRLLTDWPCADDADHADYAGLPAPAPQHG